MLQSHSRFFFAMSLAMLAVVLVGFSRTFFLRAFFDVPPIPVRVYIHALLLTGWFAWFGVQTKLVLSGRSHLHRRLGVIGAGLGVAVVIMNIATILGGAPRFRALLSSGSLPADFLIRAVWGDILATVAFAIFLALAIAWRRQPDIHKRLMLLASLSILGPAVGRIQFWPVFAEVPWIGLFLSTASLILPLGALITFDLLREHRVHRATVIGGTLRVITWVATFALAPNVGRQVFDMIIER